MIKIEMSLSREETEEGIELRRNIEASLVCDNATQLEKELLFDCYGLDIRFGPVQVESISPRDLNPLRIICDLHARPLA